MNELIPLERLKDRPKPPKPEELQLRFSEDAIKELEALESHYPTKKALTLPALWIAQREYGGVLTEEALAEVAYRLKQSYAEIEGVATFYTLFNITNKVGKHKIDVCTCIVCQVCDGYPVLNYLEKKLGIRVGETTPDGMFTLDEVECLNACYMAPAIQIGTEYHGHLNEEYLDRLIDELRSKESSTVVEQASTVVQMYLRGE